MTKPTPSAPWTRDDLVAFFDATVAECRKTLIAKNRDYAQEDNALGGVMDDDLADCGLPGEAQIVTRLNDKHKRLKSWMRSKITGVELAVEDESLDKIAVDSINYFVLLLALHAHLNGTPGKARFIAAAKAPRKPRAPKAPVVLDPADRPEPEPQTLPADGLGDPASRLP